MMQDKLFYDGQCPMCSREIRALEKLQRGGLEFVDIHRQTAFVDTPGKGAMLRVLHLQTAEKTWLTGVTATVRAWSHTGWGWIFRPLLWPGLRCIAQKVYRRWAERRYQRLYSCNRCMGGEE